MSRTRALLPLAALAAACARPTVETATPVPAPAAPAAAMPTTPPMKFAPRPTTAAITPVDLMSRLYVVADDSMQGRMTGDAGHDRATAWIAAQAQAIGLRPAGEDGGWFQQVMVRKEVRAVTPLTVDGRAFTLGADVLARDNADQGRVRAFDGATVTYGGIFGDTARMLAPAQAAGKVVILTVPSLANGQPGWQANRAALSQRYAGAAALVVASLDAMPPQVRAQLAANVGPRSGPPAAARGQVPSFLYASSAAAEVMLGAPLASARVGATGRVLRGTLAVVETPVPGRNVIAVLPGSDPALRGQYVAVGAHSDHVGRRAQGPLDHDSLRAFNRVVRPMGADSPPRAATAAEQARIRALVDSMRALRPARRDSIFNGADDDGSGTVALLEIAEAMAKGTAKPRRSILFIWHAAEEQGLFGSEYFSEHPTVPRDSIVAGINIDMLGRGSHGDFPAAGPGYLQLIGSRRLSTQLGDLVETVNRAQAQPFTFDYQFDAEGHPEQYYCRSDHYNYARWGIPVVFFSTGSHADYHMLTDEAQYIDYPKLARATGLVHDVTLRVANLDARPVVDKAKPDPYGECRQ